MNLSSTIPNGRSRELKMQPAEENFYITGGTLRPDAASYVERRADNELFSGLLAGEFCYVLTSRQMGKSSLMVRTTMRLRNEEIRVAILDLTAIGQNLTAVQWYDGLISKLGQQLDCEDEVFEFWQATENLGPLQRWITAIEKVILPKSNEAITANSRVESKTPRLVIFIDEIDMVRSLPFVTDEFFSAIRECYNRRTHDTTFQHLTFCLLGVATPSELIRDPHMTPFNIGRRIELTDFTREEAAPLANGLSFATDQTNAQALLDRIFHWTHGHPYLTQRLCRAVVEDFSRSDETARRRDGEEPSPIFRHSVTPARQLVDQLCEDLFLSARASERDDNLLFVRERLLRTEADLSSLLEQYDEILAGKAVRDDEENRLLNYLRLAGITRVENGFLAIRNAIYGRVFDEQWVQAHLGKLHNEPDQLAEFQRKHRVGLLTLFCAQMAGANRLKESLGEEASQALIQRHNSIFRELLGRFQDADEIESRGDYFFVVFIKPSDAVRFALLLQSQLRRLASDTSQSVSERIGIHLGEILNEGAAQSRNSAETYGSHVDICAKLMALAEGDQILLTRAAFDHARQVLKRDDVQEIRRVSWAHHGVYSIAGLDEPLDVCEAGETGEALLRAPSDSSSAQRYQLPNQELVLDWRPAAGQKLPTTTWVLDQKLSERGFGELWLGYDSLQKHKRRAFKFCLRADGVGSLKREAALYRLLRDRIGEHPNIVSVHEIDFDRPPFYIGIDYVDGQDLRFWWEKRGGAKNVPLAVRLEIVTQVADGLEAAHKAGIIHCHVKPSNILIENKVTAPDKLQVKLADFGLGQLASKEPLAELAEAPQVTPTTVGQAGTYIYMAPELLAGKPATPPSDIYSLGVVLYQLIVGDFNKPVTADWLVEDPYLRETLRKCFASDPLERFATAEHLAHNLRMLEQRRLVQQKKQEGFAKKAAWNTSVLRQIVVVLLWIGVAIAAALLVLFFL